MLYIILLIFFVWIIVLALLGNVLVLVLSIMTRKLPSPVNCCYVSMAIADILVAVFAMTSKIVDFGLHEANAFGEDHGHLELEQKMVEEVNSEEWSRTKIICDVHHFLRIFSCTASILHVCIVAIERCRSLDKPFGYMSQSTYLATIIELVLVWSLSLLTSAGSAIWMYHFQEVVDTETVTEGHCVYPTSAVYLVGSSLVGFFIPLFIMFGFYCKIYYLARKQLVALTAAQGTEGGQVKSAPTKSPSGHWRQFSFRMHRGGKKRSKKQLADRSTHLSVTDQQSVSKWPEESTEITEIKTPLSSQISRRISIMTDRKAKRNKSTYPTIEKLVTSFSPFGRSEFFKKWQYYVNENKAIKSLGKLLGVFVACWLPYFTLNLGFAFVGRSNVPHYDFWFDLCIWLGFLNSVFNPMLYALSSKEYQQIIKALWRNISLFRFNSNSTTSTTSTKLLNAASRNRSSLYQRRQTDIRHNIIALASANIRGGNTLVSSASGSIHRKVNTRMSITGCSLEVVFSGLSNRASTISGIPSSNNDEHCEPGDLDSVNLSNNTGIQSDVNDNGSIIQMRMSNERMRPLETVKSVPEKTFNGSDFKSSKSLQLIYNENYNIPKENCGKSLPKFKLVNETLLTSQEHLSKEENGSKIYGEPSREYEVPERSVPTDNRPLLNRRTMWSSSCRQRSRAHTSDTGRNNFNKKFAKNSRSNPRLVPEFSESSEADLSQSGGSSRTSCSHNHVSDAGAAPNITSMIMAKSLQRLLDEDIEAEESSSRQLVTAGRSNNRMSLCTRHSMGYLKNNQPIRGCSRQPLSITKSLLPSVILSNQEAVERDAIKKDKGSFGNLAHDEQITRSKSSDVHLPDCRLLLPMTPEKRNSAVATEVNTQLPKSVIDRLRRFGVINQPEKKFSRHFSMKFMKSSSKVKLDRTPSSTIKLLASANDFLLMRPKLGELQTAQEAAAPKQESASNIVDDMPSMRRRSFSENL